MDVEFCFDWQLNSYIGLLDRYLFSLCRRCALTVFLIHMNFVDELNRAFLPTTATKTFPVVYLRNQTTNSNNHVR